MARNGLGEMLGYCIDAHSELISPSPNLSRLKTRSIE
jgi:hypothetical protein